MDKLSGFYIISEFDAPRKRMLVYLAQGASTGTYVYNEGKKGYKFPAEQIRGLGTPIEDFGFEVDTNDCSKIEFALVNKSTAKYSDASLLCG